MVHSGNILTLMGIGILLMPAITITTLAFWKVFQDERKARQYRKTHRRVQTHYERLQARLLTSGGSVTRYK